MMKMGRDPANFQGEPSTIWPTPYDSFSGGRQLSQCCYFEVCWQLLQPVATQFVLNSS